jgi:trimeric autotransporter adhesin
MRQNLFSLFIAFLCILICQQHSYGQYWKLIGNADATATSILGTTNAQHLRILTNNAERMRFDIGGRVGIGTAVPNASSIVDIFSTSRGLLIPRLTTAQRNAIVGPAGGLLIFQTDGVKGFYYYDAGWKPVSPVVTTFANRNLSNLLAPTAVNVDVLPSVTNSRNLGSATLGWKELFITGEVWMDGTAFIRNKGLLNTFLGANAGAVLTTGRSNTGIGYNALINTTTGAENTATGTFAMFGNSTGSRNCAYGLNSLSGNTTGGDNTAIGANALNRNTAGYYNTAVGTQALYNNTTAYHNIAIGYNALFQNTTGTTNTAIGNYSLYRNQTGTGNIATGHFSVHSNTAGKDNTAYGHYSLNGNTIGFENVASGYKALFSNTNGFGNVGIGVQSLYQNTIGINNTAVGTYAGHSTYYILSACTFLGAQTWSGPDIKNSTAIGYEAYIGASNEVRIGNTSVSSIGGQVNWTAFSDARYKKNIKEDVPGLEFIKQLRPVTYTVDVDALDNELQSKRPQKSNSIKETTSELKGYENLSPMTKDPNANVVQEHAIPAPSEEEIASKEESKNFIHTGFLAQEVEQAAKNINYQFSGVDAPKNNEDFYGLRYAEFVVPLIKAVQELNQQNEDLEKRIEELERMISNKNLNSNHGYLQQNAPNPFSSNTTISYFVPGNASSPKVVITNMKGQTVKSISINNRGAGQVTISSGTLPAGSYNYTLWMDGKKMDSKQMILTR